MSDDPPPTLRISPVALEVGDLWSAYRSGGLSCPYGDPGHRVALSVAPEPHRYGFQCVACSWSSGWFRR